jgi:hypothetical protein
VCLERKIGWGEQLLQSIRTEQALRDKTDAEVAELLRQCLGLHIPYFTAESDIVQAAIRRLHRAHGGACPETAEETAQPDTAPARTEAG